MDKIQELLNDVCNENYTEEWSKLNYRLVPVTSINAEIGSEVKFNELYQLLLDSDYEKIVRTKSGGISVNKNIRLYHHYSWDIKQHKSVIEITICKPVNYVMRTYRIQYRNNNYKDKESNEALITGMQSLNLFSKELKKDGINLEDYRVNKEDGCRINSEIHKPDNRLFNIFYATRTRSFRACHLDFHKFYISGLMLSHPEMAATINRIASWAKTNPIYKTVLASVIGKFHSESFNYRYASLARDAINTSYEIFDSVLEKLGNDRKILFTNTDGIWYEGDEWHGDYEGPNLGQWQNDYVNKELRIKSVGSYEFRDYDTKENYIPRVKGRTKLDKVIDRNEWSWGDIFELQAQQEAYTFIEGVGIVWQKVN